jgi:hypothetical protein
MMCPAQWRLIEAAEALVTPVAESNLWDDRCRDATDPSKVAKAVEVAESDERACNAVSVSAKGIAVVDADKVKVLHFYVGRQRCRAGAGGNALKLDACQPDFT